MCVALSQPANKFLFIQTIIHAGQKSRFYNLTKSILNWLLSIFATHGFSDEVKSNNASYFVSAEFKDTLASWGIR